MELPRKSAIAKQINLCVTIETWEQWRLLRSSGIDIAKIVRPKVEEVLKEAVEQLEREQSA